MSMSEKIEAAQYYLGKCPSDNYTPIVLLAGHRGQAPQHIRNVVKNYFELQELLEEMSELGLCYVQGDYVCPNNPFWEADRYTSSSSDEYDDDKHYNNVHHPIGKDTRHDKAADFFARVIESKSDGSPYEIVRLAGHRSQAPLDVREVIYSAADLKSLFLRYPQRFNVNGNTVALIKPGKANCQNRFNNKKDPKVEKAADFFAQIIKSKSDGSPYDIKRLAGHRGQAPPDVCGVVNNEIDLKYLFLLYPERFCITGNSVSLINNNVKHPTICQGQTTSNTSSSITKGPKAKKAADYFAEIIASKSDGSPYEIARLIGHRSQAPLGVRDVVTNPTDLKSLFLLYPERFFVNKNTVLLINPVVSNCPKQLNKKDPKVEKAADFFAKIIESKSGGSPYEIKRLIGHLGRAPLDVCNVITYESDLKSLFLLYPERFTVDGNFVLLNSIIVNNRIPFVQKGPKAKKAADYFAAIIGSNPYDIKRLAGHRAQAPPYVCDVIHNETDLKFLFLLYPERFCTTGNSVSLINNNNVGHPTICQGQTSSNNMTNTSSNIAKGPKAKKAADYFAEIIESKSDGSPHEIARLIGHRSQAPLGVRDVITNATDLKSLFLLYPERFNVNGNTVSLISNARNSASHQGHISIAGRSNTSISLSSSFHPAHWKKLVMDQTEVVTSLRRCKEIVQNFLKIQKIIGLDCEGLNLGRFNGVITLMQISIQSGKIFIFDIHWDDDMIWEGGLAGILESSNILKVIHDCRNDAMNLYSQFQVTLNNIFDTQIADRVISQRNNLATNRLISFNDCCVKYNVPLNTEKENVRALIKYQCDIWVHRPLDEDLLAYAAQDVACIFPHLYTKMKQLTSSCMYSHILKLSDPQR